MDERRKLTKMRRLAIAERVRRSSADAALAEAAAVERERRSAEAEARGLADLAGQQWLDHIGGAHFSPQYGQALSAHLIEREQDADAAAAETGLATSRCAERQQEFRVADARSREADKAERRLKQDAARADEERRLAETADRVSLQWWRG